MAYRKSLDFLPSIFQTKTNEKLLQATVDQLISEPEVRRLDGYIGRRFNPALTPYDSYIAEDYIDRQNYQLEPSAVYADDNDNIKFISGYTDLLDKISSYGGTTNNPNRVFAADQYNYSGFFDFDKFVNYSSYYWLPTGPDSVNVFASEIPTDLDIDVLQPDIYAVNDGLYDFENYDNSVFDVSTNSISRLSQSGYRFSTTGDRISPVLRLARGGTYRFNVDQYGHGFFIQGTPGIEESYDWQTNLSSRNVLGVVNNGAEVGTVTFNVPTQDAQNFFLNMPIADTVNLVAYSVGKRRALKYTEVQNARYTDFISEHSGIDNVRNLSGKTILFLEDDDENRVPQPWQALTQYSENDLVIYANTVYRVLSDYASSRTFNTSNLEVYDLSDSWYDPALFDNTNVGYDASNFDRGSDVSLENQLGWFDIDINSEGIIELTPAGSISVNEKVDISEGTQYSNRQVYRTANNKLELISPITANLDFLYYQDSIDPNINGVIELVDQDNNLNINVDTILGLENYTSPTGVVFENGLKVRFSGTTVPAEYENREYYVEGVGTAIDLIAVDDLNTPESWLDTISTPFDADFFDGQAFDKSQPAPEQKQYIGIKRNSRDGSAWTRQNRWFHESVINNTNSYNNYVPTLDQQSRAKRPIIEFDAGLQLYNSGSFYKDTVTVVDTNETDVLSNVEGVAVESVDGAISGYYSDGIPLVNGNRVIFTKDPSTTVKQTIWEVRWVTVESEQNNRNLNFVGDGSTTEFDLNFNITSSIRLSVTIDGVLADEAGFLYTASGQTIEFETAPDAGSNISTTYVFGQQIHLEAVGTVKDGDVILSELGTKNQGTNWHYYNNEWKLSQTKSQDNQAPLFDLYDSNNISISDTATYSGSNFAGNKLFGYKIGTGVKDKELGIRLSYKNIDNVGDIVFLDYVANDTFSFEDGNENSVTSTTNKLNAKQNFKNKDSAYVNQWVKIKEKSKQYQLQTYFATQYQKNRFKLNVIPATLSPSDILVYKNNVALLTKDFDISIEGNIGFLDLNKDLAVNDKLDVKVFSNNYTNSSYWEIPSNLENNAKNQDIVELTLGQLRNHIGESFTKTNGVTGSFQGSNNIKDLPNVKLNGGKISQNAGAPHLANLFLNDTKANFVESLLYAQREYSVFKNKFIKLAEDMPLTDYTDPVKSVDEILTNLFQNKNEMFPFYYSDMVPGGNDYTKLLYTVTNNTIGTYYLSSAFDITTSSNRAVTVYINGQQLTYGKDYTFSKTQPVVVLNIAPERPDSNMYYVALNDGDVIEIREFSNTDGMHVPPTPSKLGLYPSTIPSMVTDGYTGSVRSVIRGHDGSLTVAFNDYRDSIILELEKRIYNNIKNRYNEDLFDIRSNIPGAFRVTDYNKAEFDNILSSNFGTWLGKNNLQLTNYDNFDSNDSFTWNYNQFTERNSNSKMIAGYWRGLYRYYYDTEQPNLRPWEMLGFAEEPSWWKNEYGPAPYTNGNSVLWDDLEVGKIRAGARQGTDSRYARPGLKRIIPVNDSGELLSPFESLAANTSIDTEGPWKFGDASPVESAWNQSSEYPYAIQLALALCKPAEYFGQLRDTNDQIVEKYSDSNQQWKFRSTGIRRKVEYVNGEVVNGVVTRSSGYLNWISDYAKSMNLDITEEVGKKLRNIDIRLAYKLGGYSDKKYLKLFADQSSPNSTNSSVLIPDNDFSIKLIKSSPRVSLTYSGVIVTNVGSGYSVTGYDQNRPYFVIEPSSNNRQTKVISAGSSTVEVAKNGNGKTAIVPYNTEFSSKAEVIDFLVSYGRHLERLGFNFNRKVKGENKLHNWDLAAEEFLFWSQQGWEDNIVITLSPMGDELEYRSSRGAVDAISNRPYGSRILNNNFDIISTNQYTASRDGRNFSLKTSNGQGIYLADLDVVDYEHVICLNNKTQFNDIIYQPELGNRQYRIKITGFKTADWDGTFGAAGFIINDNNVQAWKKGKNYYKGEIVTYKNLYYVASKNIPGATTFDTSSWLITEYNQLNSTLLPNLANRSAQPKSFYDFNDTNLELDADKLGKGLIGFSPRQYLDNLGISDTSQVKFYQGMIRQKGSNNSLDKLLRAKLDNFDGKAEIFEQWAVRDGSYGITDNVAQIRVPLNLNKDSIKNPVVVEVLDANDTPTTGRFSFKQKDLLTYKRPYSKNFISYRNAKSEVNDLTSAGFVRTDEVNYMSSNFDQLSNDIDDKVVDGSRVWIGRNDSNEWNVYRFTDSNIQLNTISISANGIATISVDAAHGLTDTDRVYVKTYPSSRFSNVYNIQTIIDDKTFTVESSFSAQNQINLNGEILKLVELYKDNITDISSSTPTNGWLNGDQFYIENATEAGWGVYEKQSRYNTVNRYVESARSLNDQLGVSIASARNNNYLLAGNNTSTVQAFKRNTTTGVLAEDAKLENISTGLVDFGATLSASSFGTAAIGSPLSGNVGYVHVAVHDTNNSFIIDQALSSSTQDASGEYGRSVAVSNNGGWLYVGQPGSNKVWAYQYITVTGNAFQTLSCDGSTATFTLTGDLADPSSIYALKIVNPAGKLLIPFRDYTLSSNDITFTTAPDFGEATVFLKSHYNLVEEITVPSGTGDQFGYSIATSDDGSQVIIGSPTADDHSTLLTDSGKVYIIDRTIESFYANGTTKVFTTDSAVQGNAKVTVDGIVKTVVTDYTITGNDTFTFITAPDTGSIVTIESNNFVLSETIDDFEDPQIAAQFGYSLDLCPNNCSLYIGAPYEDDSTIDGGKVHRFINQGRFFGNVSGTTANPVISSSSKLLINNFLVSFSTSDNLASIVETINTANIPGITASSSNNKLKIDTDRVVFADKLNLVSVAGSFFADTGIDVYASQQVIASPRNKNYNNFGKVVKVNTDASYLAVGSDQGDARLLTTFDAGATSFDNTATTISSLKTQSGSVFVYQLISKPNSTADNPAELILAEELAPNDIKEFDRFGTAIDFSNNTIYVGAPGSDYKEVSTGGIVYSFTNTSAKDTWELLRSESPKLDLNLINKVYLYNTVSGEKIVDLDIIDPAKGFVTGVAKQEISYQTEIDPATYSDTTNAIGGVVWGSEHSNEIWWNTALTQWTEYAQDDIEYRAANWGFSFPGSTIMCAEWTESTESPENYKDANNPSAYALDTSNFNVFSEYNQKTGKFDTKYYFWVVGKTRAPKGVNNRNLSTVQIEELISNPKLNNVPFVAFYDSNCFGIYNVSRFVQDDTAIVVDYDVAQNNGVFHNEYKIIADGDKNSIPTAKTVTKLIDSLAGQDKEGNLVPDIALNNFEKYGIGFRPRQTMFVDRARAVRESIAYMNRFFVSISAVYSKDISDVIASDPLPSVTEYNEAVNNRVELDYLVTGILATGYKVLVKSDETTRNRWVIYNLQANNTWVKHRIQSYNNARYIEYVNWSDPDVDVPAVVETVVDFEYNLQSLTASEGDFVKIRDNGDGLFKIVLRQNNSWNTVQQENGTIQIKESIWKTSKNLQGWDQDGFGLQLFDDWPSLEIQNIMRSVYNKVFADGDSVEKNQWFLHMIKYAVTENQYNDWAFKTSLIKVNQTQRALQQIPVYQQDNQDSIRQYINEVKPYHTKISEFVLSYNGTDTASTKTTDFDLPAYYNFATNQYRSPTGQTVEDDIVLNLEPYIDWTNNYTLQMSSVDVSHKGSGYIVPPVLTVTGGGGSGAKLEATINNGSITSVTVVSPGSGYITTPTITIGIETSDPALLAPRLVNTKVRSFDTTIKFDRVATSAGWLVHFKNASGEDVNVKSESISRTTGAGGVIDEVLDILSKGAWIGSDIYPVAGVPNYRFVDNTSGRVQFYERRDTRGWTPELLQTAIQELGASVGTNSIDVSGTTVTEDGSLASFMSSVLPWTKGLTYYQGEYIGNNNKLYLVDQQFTAGSSFTSENLTESSGADLVSHLDRITAFYQPNDGMLGKDLSQLVDGVVFPGINVAGANFNQNPGFDASNFDIEGLDSSVIGPEGVPVIDPAVLDQTLYSKFLDTTLGTAPEDIITQGGKFLDTYHSHAPEEMVPGRVYDTLDIRVHTLATNTAAQDINFGIDWNLTSYRTNGVTKRFGFDLDNNHIGDHFMVYLKNGGPRYRDIADSGQEVAFSSEADPEYNNGTIINVTGDGSDFFKREVTTNGVRVMGAGTVGGQTAVPDAWLEKVARMVELFTDPNGAGINEEYQRNLIQTLSGDAGTYHAGQPTIQRVARGAGADYTPNFLTDAGVISWNLTNLFDNTVQNDMVWYLNSTGDGYGDGDIDAQEVIEHVFHTLHMHGLPADDIKLYQFLASDWQTGDLYAAMEEAYDAGKWDPSGYQSPSDAWKTDADAFEVAAKEYLFLLNFAMFEYTELWDGGSLAPEWTDDMRTQAGIQANNPLGYAFHNTYIATAISKPSLATIRSIFQDGNTPAQDDPRLAGAPGYIANSIPEGSYYATNQTQSYTVDYSTNEIVFESAPADNDVLQIYNVRLQGESIIVNEHFEADGSTTAFTAIAPFSKIANHIVLVNGVETQDGDLVLDIQDSNRTAILFNNAPSDGSHIHFVGSSNSDKNTISKPYTQLEMVSDVNRSVVLDETIRYDRSKDTVLVVEFDGNRLRPGNTNYYTGDGSTAVYQLPTSAAEEYSSLTFAEVNVWVDGVRQDASDYELSDADGSSIPTVTFFVAPVANANISITYTTDAEYYYDAADNTVRISDDIDVSNGSLLAITSFSSHDVYRIKTKVFVGSEQLSKITDVDIKFDTVGFDNELFDSTSSVSILDIAYPIDSDQTNSSEIMVSINGRKMAPNIDYTVSNNGTDSFINFADSIVINETDVIVITWSIATEYKTASTFQIFKDMNNSTSYNRLSTMESTVLARNLNLTDTEIVVEDASNLADPGPQYSMPGVVFINAERITYYTKTGNTLGQIRRGTSGTGSQTQHKVGDLVIDASERTVIPGRKGLDAGAYVWYNENETLDNPSDGTGLQAANTIPAKFLTEKTGIVVSRSAVDSEINTYIQAGYVEDGYIE